MTLASSLPAVALDAFPGAVGHGRESQGGRGGRIVKVVNLNESGPGSLRDCVEGTGPRSCIFEVAGVITLERALLIDGPDASHLSILGQSAPGEGITITVDPRAEGFMRTPLIVRDTHDIVLRHLRLRPRFPNSVANVDALTVEGSLDVYVDHVSGSWATDENFNAYAQTSDLTVANSIFGEGLQKHSKCALLGSDPQGPQNITFTRNLCASNNDRNPDTNHFAGSCVEIVDNLFYNARAAWVEVFSQRPGGTPASYVGNYFKGGPSTLARTSAIDWNSVQSVASPSIYIAANAAWSPPSKSIAMVASDTERHLVESPPCVLEAPTFGDAERTYRQVLSEAGSFPRDRVDRRLLAEVGELGAEGSGKVRGDPGRIDPIAPASAYRDGDGDGMADAIEPAIGADPQRADGWTSVDADGWPAFDRFMEWLSQERLAGRYPH